jgi:DNA repair exonuclease SbcCD ATPase subunit
MAFSNQEQTMLASEIRKREQLEKTFEEYAKNSEEKINKLKEELRHASNGWTKSLRVCDKYRQFYQSVKENINTLEQELKAL